MTAEEYQRALDRTGGQVVPLAEAERWALLQEWRRVFAVWLHAATGRWKQQFEWDVFCGEYARALNAEKAAAAYAAEQPAAIIVCPESGELPAVRVEGGELPGFRVEARKRAGRRCRCCAAADDCGARASRIRRRQF